MEQFHDLNENEKKLLNALGKFPDISTKELFNYTTYRWAGTIARKLKKLRAKHILWGFSYNIDFGKWRKRRHIFKRWIAGQ